MSLSPAAYISAKSLPLPAAGGVRSSATDRRSTMVAAGAGVLGDGFVSTAAYVALPADELSGAVCADIGGMAVPTLGYTTPTADAVLADELPWISEVAFSFSIIVSRSLAVSNLAARLCSDSKASRPSRSFNCLAAECNSAS